MTSSRYPYPSDEFDAPAPAGSPVGVHRSPRSTWTKVWPFLLVAAICAVLAVAAVLVVSKLDGSSPSSDGGAPAPAATASTAPSASGDATEGSDGPTGDDEESPTPSETPSETPTTDADLSVEVRVLNGAGVSGLANEAADKLTDDGFTDVTPANYEGGSLDASAVWYRTDDDKAAAEEAARVLGIDETLEVPSLRAAVSVILMDDIS
ncbi:LytR cell envelope-related transcriptional attenuator [Cellulomonas sp. PhB143]|nr:LytR C-terminal domain-containing protein [Cellulomonas sp. PhB143]ROS78778.1 LytR cell envelope-related transcriptional attenuator [Cellulomonas sp. PhB143]